MAPPSSRPEAASTDAVGASTWAMTETSSATGVEVAVVTSPVSGSVSCAVAETCREKSVSKSSGRETVRPSTSAAATVHSPVLALNVPAESCAPSGTPVIVTETISPLMSSAAAWGSMLSAIGPPSSKPEAASTVTAGASACDATETSMVAVWVAVSPFASVEVAVTVSAKSAPLFGAGVTVSPSSCDGVRSTEVLPSDAVKEMPFASVTVAPGGMSEMVTLSVSEPSVSVSADEISRAIGPPSSMPDRALSTFRVGTSATPSMPTEMVPVVGSDVLSPSLVTTETPRSKSTSLFAGGVICKPSRSASERTTVPSSLTVIGPLALDRVAPSGMPESVISAVSLSSALSMEIGRAMPVSSSPEAVPSSRVAPSARLFGSTDKV